MAMAAKSGVEMRAGVDEDDVDEIRRGEGGYEGGDPSGSGGIRRGAGGYEGGTVPGAAGGEAQGEVRQLIAALEARIKQLEEEARSTKKESKEDEVEFVDIKSMKPSVL